jgi:hypothetical protein
MESDRMRRHVRGNKIGQHVESIGHGLVAAGLVLLALLFLGAYLRAGLEGLVDAVNPWVPGNYLSLLAVVPGLTLIWLGRKMSAR